MQKIKTKRYKRNSGRRKRLALACLFLAGATLLGILEATGKIDLMGGKTTPPSNQTIGSTTKGEPEEQAQTSPGGKKKPDGAASKTLRAPSGDFVSNHEPNLDGDPAPDTLESVCVTTPGASCTISFKQNGIIKTLPAQMTDAEGAAYWNWKLQDYGLTTGEWIIVARATLGDQTKTSEDSLKLTVKP